MMGKISSKNMRNIYKYFLIAILLFVITGCNSSNSYYDKRAIATDNKYNAENLSTNFDYNSKTFVGRVGKLSGCVELAQANIKGEIDSEIYFHINANRGKAKLVLVESNSSVKVLKEVIAEKNSSYDGKIPVHCFEGDVKIKIVGDDYSGDFRILPNEDLQFVNVHGRMFDEGFPFNA